MECDESQVYDVRAECPRTCANLDGIGCGELKMTEGCYCKSGFVQGTNNTCFPMEKCGCEIPGEKIRIKVNLKKSYF